MLNRTVPARGRFLRATGPMMALILSLALGACATLPPNYKPDPRDRWERMNRSIYAFNVKVDHAVLRPTARAYVRAVPKGGRTAVSNFLSNVKYPTTILNEFLQGRFRNGLSDTARLVVNTLFGLGGLFDVATPSGLDRHSADFGQTLGRWGVHSGPYVMLPVLGPSTVRDAVGLLPDTYTTPYTYLSNLYARYGLWGVDLLDIRASLLPEDRYIDSAYDPYAFLRNAWLQRREYQVHPERSEQDLPPDLGDDSGDTPPSH